MSSYNFLSWLSDEMQSFFNKAKTKRHIYVTNEEMLTLEKATEIIEALRKAVAKDIGLDEP